jgi:hypothetical protein
VLEDLPGELLAEQAGHVDPPLLAERLDLLVGDVADVLREVDVDRLGGCGHNDSPLFEYSNKRFLYANKASPVKQPMSSERASAP